MFSERITGLAEALERIYAKTEKQFIFLIDEWDCVMRERQESEELQKKYLDFLRDLLKDQPYVALTYVTGILPIKKFGQHSALCCGGDEEPCFFKLLDIYRNLRGIEVLVYLSCPNKETEFNFIDCPDADVWR